MTSSLRVVPELLRALRADLAAAQFTVDGIADLLGPLASGALSRDQSLPADLATRDGYQCRQLPAATLVRLFALGRGVEVAARSAALPSVRVEGLVHLGLVAVSHALVFASCDLRPYADERQQWWVASDLSELQTGGPLRQYHVLGIGGASLTLASWTVRPAVERALDLGTGCGVQVLHLGAHAASIVATDISERALGYARFNAALNGLDLELRAGNMLEPVAGQRFDLIVSNPPFVITPRIDDVPLFEYRDGGLRGDAIVEGLVRSIGNHLEPAGIAQFLANWEIPAGVDWRERVGGWLSGTGLDAWVIQRDVQDPAQYAETWARDGGHHCGTTQFERMYAAWLADFASRGVESIGFGVVILQRPVTGRDTWQVLEEVGRAVASPLGPALLAGIRARTWLAEHGEEGVLSGRWRCADDVTEERHARPGAEDPSVIVIRQGGGLGRALRVDTVVAAFVSVCDGELTAAQALDAIASLLRRSAT